MLMREKVLSLIKRRSLSAKGVAIELGTTQDYARILLDQLHEDGLTYIESWNAYNTGNYRAQPKDEFREDAPLDRGEENKLLGACEDWRKTAVTHMELHSAWIKPKRKLSAIAEAKVEVCRAEALELATATISLDTLRSLIMAVEIASEMAPQLRGKEVIEGVSKSTSSDKDRAAYEEFMSKQMDIFQSAMEDVNARRG